MDLCSTAVKRSYCTLKNSTKSFSPVTCLQYPKRQIVRAWNWVYSSTSEKCRESCTSSAPCTVHG